MPFRFAIDFYVALSLEVNAILLDYVKSVGLCHRLLRSG